jgi:hypothetical protein
LITWIDRHPLILFYLVGSFLVVVLSIFKLILFRAVDWIIKANILNRNLRKLHPPDNMTFGGKATELIVTLVIEALLSWANVVYAL